MIGTGSFNVKGIELTPTTQDQFGGNGIRLDNTSDQSFTIISFYQRFSTNAISTDNVFFSVGYQDFYYCKLKYWVGREGYNHPINIPSYVYYFEEECLWNSNYFPPNYFDNRIIVAEGWDEYIRTNTNIPPASDPDYFFPIYETEINTEEYSRPAFDDVYDNIIFRKPIRGDDDNQVHVRGIAYLL